MDFVCRERERERVRVVAGWGWEVCFCAGGVGCWVLWERGG